MPDAVVSAAAYWTSVVVVLGLCAGLCLLALRRPGPWPEIVVRWSGSAWRRTP